MLIFSTSFVAEKINMVNCRGTVSNSSPLRNDRRAATNDSPSNSRDITDLPGASVKMPLWASGLSKTLASMWTDASGFIWVPCRRCQTATETGEICGPQLAQNFWADGNFRQQHQRLWWARRDSNPQPSGYEPPALTIELQAPRWLDNVFPGAAQGFPEGLEAIAQISTYSRPTWQVRPDRRPRRFS